MCSQSSVFWQVCDNMRKARKPECLLIKPGNLYFATKPPTGNHLMFCGINAGESSQKLPKTFRDWHPTCFRSKVSWISLIPLWNEIVDLGLDGLCLGKGRSCTRKQDFCLWSSEGGMNAKRKVIRSTLCKEFPPRHCSIKQPCSSLPLF